jgi:hypothetical protein
MCAAGDSPAGFTSRLPRTKVWPVCRPVIREHRVGVPTVQRELQAASTFTFGVLKFFWPQQPISLSPAWSMYDVDDVGLVGGKEALRAEESQIVFFM